LKCVVLASPRARIYVAISFTDSLHRSPSVCVPPQTHQPHEKLGVAQCDSAGESAIDDVFLWAILGHEEQLGRADEVRRLLLMNRAGDDQ